MKVIPLKGQLVEDVSHPCASDLALYKSAFFQYTMTKACNRSSAKSKCILSKSSSFVAFCQTPVYQLALSLLSQRMSTVRYSGKPLTGEQQQVLRM